MKYISDNNFVHGNLMACNVMVSSTNECKVGIVNSQSSYSRENSLLLSLNLKLELNGTFMLYYIDAKNF